MLLFDLSQVYDRVRVRGSTRLDFLHRMSTGDLLKLQPGQGKTTVLTTPIGRMVDYLIALAFEDSLLLLTGDGNQDKVLRWLRKYIFFNDDVQLSDETNTTQMFGVFDDAQLVEKMAGDDTSILALPPLAHRTVNSSLNADGRVTLIRAPQALGMGFFLIGSALDLDPEPLSRDALHMDFDAYRILQGYPRFPNEINEDTIPLEAGLWDAVSFDKGCYVGQEIIARMESRGQIAKRLVKLASGEDRLDVGAELLSNGEPVGKVTSATRGMALGYVRTAYATGGQSLTARSGATVKVIELVHLA